jgi:hypothetical protein
MNKEPTEFQYFKAWLFFLVIAAVGTWLIGLIVGSFVAAFMYGGGASLAQATQVIRIVHYVIAILMSYLAFRGVAGKYLIPKIIWED